MIQGNPVFVAIDTGDLAQALLLVDALRGLVGGVKLGLEFFLAQGAAGYRQIAGAGLPIFLDLKLHDIPNTVAKAIAALLPLAPAYITIHAAGGAAMLQAATAASQTAGIRRPKLLGVTVLTSLDAADLTSIGQDADTAAQVLRLARLAQAGGLDGVICSPAEVAMLRAALGPDFILMVPGIRPDWAGADDQKRALTPSAAMQAGATHLVIGRPITASADPAVAARRIAAELGA